jgi:hypothetical protein
MNLLIMKCSSLSYFFFSLSPNIVPSALLASTLSMYVFFPQMKDQVSHSYVVVVVGKSLLVYRLTLMFAFSVETTQQQIKNLSSS